MNEKWSDFEKFVFSELNAISTRLSRLEGKTLAIGGLAGAFVAGIVEFIAGKMNH